MRYPPLEPGIYFGLDEERYHMDPALNNSGIKLLNESPSSYWKKSAMNTKRKPYAKPNNYRIGGATHCLLFEPENFEHRYHVQPGDPYDESKTMIKAYEYNSICEMVDIIRGMQDVKFLLGGGYREVTIVWDDENTGVRFRTRHDYFLEWATVDYKTADNIYDNRLKYTLRDFGYTSQDALYTESRKAIRRALLDGKADIYADDSVSMTFIDCFLNEGQNGKESDFFYFIFQLKAEPYLARVLSLDEASRDYGYMQIQKGVTTYLEYMQKYGTSAWPASRGKLEVFSIYEGSQYAVEE